MKVIDDQPQRYTHWWWIFWCSRSACGIHTPRHFFYVVWGPRVPGHGYR